MPTSHRADVACNVVIFPSDGCSLDFATATPQHLAGLLDLTSPHSIIILRQSSSFLRLRCTDWRVKRHILSWDVRSTAATQFAVRIKEDLTKAERLQKATLWSTMQALFAAGMRPTWDRSSVTWKANDIRHHIHPGELPTNLTAAEIVVIAKRRCGMLVQHERCSTATQTDTVGTAAPVETANLIVALQQDLALAKQRTAVKTIECCMLRKKVALANRVACPARTACSRSTQADIVRTGTYLQHDAPNSHAVQAYEAKVGPPKLSKCSSSQTHACTTAHVSVQACMQTDTSIQQVEEIQQQMIAMQQHITNLQTHANTQVAEAQALAQQLSKKVETLTAHIAKLEKKQGKR
jgi:hypothetical protein